jgi:hypothetical protein
MAERRHLLLGRIVPLNPRFTPQVFPGSIFNPVIGKDWPLARFFLGDVLPVIPDIPKPWYLPYLRNCANTQLSLQVIELRRVLAHDFCLQRVGQILALHHFFDGVGKLGVAVVVVGGEDQPFGADELGDVGQHLFVHLERVIHLPALHVFARRFGEPEHGRLEKLEVLVEPLHPIGHPAAACFDERELSPDLHRAFVQRIVFRQVLL